MKEKKREYHKFLIQGTVQGLAMIVLKESLTSFSHTAQKADPKFEQEFDKLQYQFLTVSPFPRLRQ